MSHILIGLALCAGVLLYPGGLALLGASCLLALGSSIGRRASWRVWAARAWLPLGLGSLAVIPLPWPGNPLLALSVGGLSQVGVGGLALTVLGILALELRVAAGEPDRGARVIASTASMAALVILAEVLRAPDWGSLLAAPGPGAEAGRLGLGAICLLAAPWAAGQELGADADGTCAWAARASVAGFLVIPQVSGWPVWAGIGGWLLACLLLGSLWASGQRLIPGGPTDPGWRRPAGRLRSP